MTKPPRRILIVDDNADTARMLKVLLKGEGHETCVASDGPEAIEAAKLSGPDVVLLDLTLPGMSGIEVATELRGIAALAACKLVAITGHSKERLPHPSPFDNHFLKPVNLTALLDYLAGLPSAQAPAPCSSMAVA
jgi:CheY-like chemotaxis protein